MTKWPREIAKNWFQVANFINRRRNLYGQLKKRNKMEQF